MPLLATFVDFSKAFDSVDRNALFKVLRHYGIPRKITDAITAMYTNSSSQAHLVNHFSKSFSIITAVLQGDTLAPFLFIIVVDCFLQQTDDSHGLKTHAENPEKTRICRFSVSWRPNSLTFVRLLSTKRNCLE